MRTLIVLTTVAAALCAGGCGAISIEKSAKPSTQQLSALQPMVDPYEPDGGGQNMTPSAPKFIYYHTVYPAGDVDFRYMESVGDYELHVQPARAALRVRVWTRPSRLHGPSTLVDDTIAGTGRPTVIPFTLTADKRFVVVRVEAAPGAGWTVYYVRFLAR